MRAKLFFVVIVLMITGCASSPVPLEQNIKQLSEPEIGVITQKNIGDTLLLQGKVSTYPAIEVLHDIKGIAGLRGSIVKGVYIATHKEGTDTFFLPDPNDQKMNNLTGIFFLVETKDNEIRMAYRNTGAAGGIFKTTTLSPSDYRMTEASIESSSNFQQTLIYTGKENNIIKMTYREYSGNLARPAFTIDITYDLNESKIIAFREAKLEIIEATNTSIKYKVINNFS